MLVGVNFAKGLAYSAGKPLVSVHHLRGHIAALYLTHPELKPPSSALWRPADTATSWRCRTIPITTSSATRWTRRRRSFDKVARTLGLPYPGGPSVANAAKTGDPKATVCRCLM